MFATSSQRFLRTAIPKMNASQISNREVARTIRFQPRNDSSCTMGLPEVSKPNFSSILRGKNSMDLKTRKGEEMRMQKATLAPHIMQVMKQSQDSVVKSSVAHTKELAESVGVRLKNSINLKTRKVEEMRMQKATLAPVIKESQDSVVKSSVSHTKELAESVGVRLTPNELATLRQKLAETSEKTIQDQINTLSQEALSRKATREICLSVICSDENKIDKWGVQVINFFDYLGTALFAVVGAQVAGDAGMNLVGCSLVGCAAAMGGGSINALLYGGTTPLLAKSPGVRWVANPTFLIVAMVASVVTFFGWPYYCKRQANQYIEDAIGKQNIDESDTISREAFLNAFYYRERFQQTIRDALPNLCNNKDQARSEIRLDQLYELGDGAMFFDYIDSDSSGDIDRDELRKLVQHRFYNGWETYWLETFGLSSLSMAAVGTAIRCGLHPIVAATSGVTVCFGGIIRDLLVGRDIKVGSQSYAFATGASSATYILLRELTIRRILVLPLVVRTFMSAGACIALRGYEFLTGTPILRPMHSDEVMMSSKPQTTTYTIAGNESFGRGESDSFEYVYLSAEKSFADTLNSPFNYEMTEAARVVL